MTALLFFAAWFLVAVPLAVLVGWFLDTRRDDDTRIRCDHCFAVLPMFGEGNIFRHTLRAHPDSELAAYLRAEVDRALR